jgi:hypothetical protein
MIKVIFDIVKSMSRHLLKLVFRKNYGNGGHKDWGIHLLKLTVLLTFYSQQILLGISV